ncbi:DUF397 domain-containing protein [Catenuloplanes atrovinosus]|uniref:DUF397 domain-containing protein n=1 Tax=Catenuloplanes atrovinosus TaxID=137266 RepID=A0AAE3YQB7_9ACTN|nr:DUF397 domain-containing protein [Catenuloplanes atrovinosus]MDR7275841.1 hypothetical protein [Catenuloplanes atrovinosus]
MDVDHLTWLRASACRDGYCVEVAASPSGTFVRDAKDGGHGPVLRFTAEAWTSFVKSLHGSVDGAGRA